MFIMYIVVYSVLNGSGMFYEKEEVQREIKTRNYIPR